MITGDNKVTAAAIATEAGGGTTSSPRPRRRDKLDYIRRTQAEGPPGRHVRRRHQRRTPPWRRPMWGVAMQTGTQAAREAGNMVDLDSDPTKLIEIVEIGKQLLITRGSLTTFSIANDVSKYFAILPAIFVVTYPELGRAQHHAAALAAERDPVGGDLQRANYHRPGAAGAARRVVPCHRGGGTAEAQPTDLRPGRPGRPRSSASS